MSNDAAARATLRRIPGLDGLRAISIAIVLAGHVAGTRGYPGIATVLRPLCVNGALGVAVFFVISGFLITSLLIRERDATGENSLGSFYTRRALRIFPAYYTYLAVVVAVSVVRARALSHIELASALTYTRNFYPHGGWETGHAWSLAIEEQFYLAWPLALGRLGRSRAVRFAAIAIAAGPVIRLATYILVPAHRDMIDWYTFTRIDTILCGCLLALVHRHPRFVDVTQRFYRLGGVYLCIAAVLASSYLRAFGPWNIVASYSVEAISVALIIQWCTTNADTRVGRLLEWQPVRAVGDLSYSLYLWQQLFLNRHSDALVCSFPINIACAFAAAIASRHIVELPFLRLKSRLAAPDAAPRVSVA